MSPEKPSARPRSKRRSGSGRRSQRPAPKRQVPAAPTARGRLIFIAVLAVLIAIGTAAPVLIWATLDGPGGGAAKVTAFNGRESASEVGERLQALGLVDSPRLFAVYLDWFAPKVHVAEGTHLLRGGLSPRRLAQRIGRLPSRPSARVTFPEGYTHLQLGERLEAKEICTRAELAKAVKDKKLVAELGIAGTSVEGYLFPATYEFLVDSDPAQIIRQLVGQTRKRLSRIDARLAGALGKLSAARNWGEFEVLTLASVVEREASLAEEQRLIARVFLNRLDDPSFRPTRMLQSDPTASYGCAIDPGVAPSCAKFAGKVTPEMLRDAQNPYNTYRHAGLPPGPIGNPGEGAIEAVLNPAQVDYLYFVADGHGRHRFSRRFEDHRRAIEQGSERATP